MGIRFRKSIKLAPGLRLNLGKNGASVSAGPRGATMNFSSKGVRSTVGIPGTGLSYSATAGATKSGPGTKKTAYEAAVGNVPEWNFGMDIPAPPRPRTRTRSLSMTALILGVAVLFSTAKDHPEFAALGLLGAPVAGIVYLIARARDAGAARRHAEGVAALRHAGQMLADDQLTVLLYFARGDSRLQRAERDIIVEYAVQEELIPATGQVDLDEAIRKLPDPGTPAYREALSRLAQFTPEDRRERLLSAVERIMETGKASEDQRRDLETARAELGVMQ